MARESVKLDSPEKELEGSVRQLEKELELMEKLHQEFEKLAACSEQPSGELIATISQQISDSVTRLQKLPLSQTVQQQLKQLMSIKGVTSLSLGQAVRSNDVGKWLLDVFSGPTGKRQDLLAAKDHLSKGMDDVRSQLETAKGTLKRTTK